MTVSTARQQPALPGMIDARERVTGLVPYVMDVAVPGMLHAKLLRSTAAHARIVSIDISRAREVPGVVAVVTGADLVESVGHLSLLRARVPRSAGAGDRAVRFVGEPVVAVAATDLDAAAEALDLVSVEYEELPAVFDATEAFEPGAPLVHAEPPRLGQTFADVIINNQAGTNICNHFKLRKGDVEAASRPPRTSSRTCSPARPCSTCRSRPTSAWPRSPAAG